MFVCSVVIFSVHYFHQIVLPHKLLHMIKSKNRRNIEMHDVKRGKGPDFDHQEVDTDDEE